MIQQTSLVSYHQLRKMEDISDQQRRLLATYYVCGDLSDTEAEDKSGLEINAVCGRRNELIQDFKLIADKGRERRGFNNRMVIVWGIPADKKAAVTNFLYTTKEGKQ
jgi:hypothetical protein